jgi:hypothetical protein
MDGYWMVSLRDRRTKSSESSYFLSETMSIAAGAAPWQALQLKA